VTVKQATKIALACGAFLATQATALAEQPPSAARVGIDRGASIALAPAASTEEFHAPEATNILPLLNDYEAFALRLLLTKGHLRAGVEAYESGNINNALAHLGQPVDVLHQSLDKWIGTPGAEPVETPTDALVAAVRAKLPADAVNRELTSALGELDRAIEKLDADIREAPAFVMLVAIAVLRAAADEYEIAVSEGQVVDVIEYQDARAFVLEARTFTEGASAHLKARNAGAYGILQAEFAALNMELPPAAQFERTATTAAALHRAVVRIGLLYDSFK
jgi:hypothetical protein